MDPKRRFRLVSSIAVVLLATSLTALSERKISKSDLPPAVLKAANEVSQDATVKAYTVEREDGKLEYEVEMVVNGRSRDVTISSDGQILEIEEQVDLSSLSPAVQEALKKRAGKGTITKVESLTKRGRLVAYEAQVRTAGKRSEIQVGPDGQKLNHEE